MPDDDLRDDDIRAQDPLLQSHVARGEHADPRDLVTLAADPLSEVHLNLAEWGALPVEAVELLARSPDPNARRSRQLDLADWSSSNGPAVSLVPAPRECPGPTEPR